VGGRNLRAGGGSDELMKSEALSRWARNLDKRENPIPLLLGIVAGGVEGSLLTWAWFNLALAFSRRSSSSTISSSIACDCEESTVSLFIGEACSRELYNVLSSDVPRIKVHQVAQSKCPKLGSAGCGSNDSLGFYPLYGGGGH
jgi:hypothetical protein